MSLRVSRFDEAFRFAVRKHQESHRLLSMKNPSGMKLLEDAKHNYHACLNAAPDQVDVLFMLGVAELQSGHAGAAIQYFKRVIEIDEKYDGAWINLGAAYRQEFHNKEAREAYYKARKLHPDNADVLANLCALSVNEGNPGPGAKICERALELDPENPHAAWNLALLSLEMGDYQKGFELYSAGYRSNSRVMRTYDEDIKQIPLWPGPGHGGNVVVWGEQGIGDELLFSTFLPSMAKDCNVIFDCHPRLVSLFRRCLPKFGITEIYPTRKEVGPEWAVGKSIDYKISICDIAKYYWRDGIENNPYLSPDPERVEHYRKMIKATQDMAGQTGMPSIGIGWMGGYRKTRTDQRMVPLDLWRKVIEQPVTTFSLQYTEHCDEDIKAFTEKTGLEIYHWPKVVYAFDYMETAAFVSALDLVIAINTSVVHLCGVLGKECWTLTPHKHAWRYGQKEITMPWYESVRQYHQGPKEQWKTVMNRVAGDLKRWIK